MDATNRNEGEFRFYIHLKMVPSKGTKGIYASRSWRSVSKLCDKYLYRLGSTSQAYCCATYACTVNVHKVVKLMFFKKFCHLCNKLDTKERIEGFGGVSYNRK
jgi:hypothetical protein